MDLALSTSARAGESKEVGVGPVPQFTSESKLDFLQQPSISKVANDYEHLAGVSWQSVCLEED